MGKHQAVVCRALQWAVYVTGTPAAPAWLLRRRGSSSPYTVYIACKGCASLHKCTPCMARCLGQGAPPCVSLRCCCRRCRTCIWPGQAHAVACLFICQKLDSVYHRLDSIVHSAIVELRKMQKRQMEPEYFNPDGVGPTQSVGCRHHHTAPPSSLCTASW